MNRRLLFLPAAALSAVVVLAACGGSSATGSPAGGTSAPAATTSVGATAAPTQVAAATQAPGASQPAASFAPDTTLAAEFPATIDGQPVTDVQTGFYVDLLSQIATSADDMTKAIAVFNSVGLDLTKVSFGSADATVDGEAVELVALRAPGVDANSIIQNYAVLSGALDASPPPPPTMTQSTIAGKNVTIATDSSGTSSVLYPSGDTLFLISGTTDSQNTKIIQALP